MKDIAYFISDAHLGIEIAGGEQREAALISFLAEISSRAGQLFIVGDLFDFWIEYRRAIRPDYFLVLSALHQLVRTGTEVHYCLGNHDFAVGPFIEKVLGIKVHRAGFSGSLQGKRVFVTHGDDLPPGDRANLVLRKVLRNRSLQMLYKVLHPNIGVPLGEFFSCLSRNHLFTEPTPVILDRYRLAVDKLLNAGYEMVIAGHTHIPELCQRDAGVYCNTGNWIHNYSFAMLTGGEISLQTYCPDSGVSRPLLDVAGASGR